MMQSPTPGQAKAGKDRVDRGYRLSGHLPGERPAANRPFFCRSCGKEELGVVIPSGWYSLARHTGNVLEKPQRLGVYCGLDCLSEQLPRLAGVADELGAGWAQETARYRQRPT